MAKRQQKARQQVKDTPPISPRATPRQMLDFSSDPSQGLTWIRGISHLLRNYWPEVIDEYALADVGWLLEDIVDATLTTIEDQARARR